MSCRKAKQRGMRKINQHYFARWLWPQKLHLRVFPQPEVSGEVNSRHSHSQEQMIKTCSTQTDQKKIKQVSSGKFSSHSSPEWPVSRAGSPCRLHAHTTLGRHPRGLQLPATCPPSAERRSGRLRHAKLDLSLWTLCLEILHKIYVWRHW